MSSMAQTSLFAYKSIKRKLGAKQQTVYLALKELGKATNENLADYLGWPINQVTGRVNELFRYGMVINQGTALSKSGRPSKVWAPKDVNDKALLDMAQDCDD